MSTRNHTNGTASTKNEEPDADDMPSLAENLGASFVILVMSVVGLVAYIHVFYVVVKNYSSKFKNGFYPFILSLAISDILTLSVFLFYTVPATIIQFYPLGDTFDIYMGAVLQISFYSAVPCIMAIAVNRYWGVCRFQTYEQTFSKRNLKIMIGLLWVLGLLATAPFFIPGFCTVRYHPTSYAWSYDIEQWGCYYHIVFERSMVVATGLTIIVCYGFILARKRKQKKAVGVKTARTNDQQRAAAERQNSEVRLAMNFLIVAVYLVCFDVVFTTLPEFTFYRWHNFVSSCMYIVNAGMNPFIYITLNNSIKESLASTVLGKFLKLKTGTGSTVRNVTKTLPRSSGRYVPASGPAASFTNGAVSLAVRAAKSANLDE